jgi:ABC-type enterobactin transport system permease subunit
LGIVALALAFWTMNSMDEMKLSSVFPMMIAQAILISTALIRMRDLVVPLWMGRQVLKWTGIQFLITMLVGYSMLQKGYNQDEQRKLFLDY